MTRVFIVIVAAVMGVSAGASLAEVVLLVPFWIEMEPAAFFDWYAANRTRLTGFYSPLQILSAAGGVLAGAWLLLKNKRGRWEMSFSAVCAVAVLFLFFVYFKDANAAFARRTIPAGDLTAALIDWGRWQWARVALATLAFLAALLSLPNESE